jgi:class 3 adenylate cyclase
VALDEREPSTWLPVAMGTRHTDARRRRTPPSQEARVTKPVGTTLSIRRLCASSPGARLTQSEGIPRIVTTPPPTEYAPAPDGVQIAYQVTGGGDLDLVFMQGAVAHLELAWEDPRLSRLFERLSAISRLIRFDRRGMGMSGVTDRPATLEEQVRDFAAVMDAVGSEQAALFGTIDAGTIALSFAATYAERTRAVIAFETAPRWTQAETDDFGIDADALSSFAQATQAMDIDAQLAIVAPSRQEDPAFRSWFRRYTRSAQSGIPIGVIMMMMMSWDIRDLLPTITAPVLVLNREEHNLLPLRNARALAEALPNARLAALPGSDTAIFSSDVDAVADEIQEFLTGSRPPPRHDRILATVLFTDVVGSTERAATMGDRDWKEQLERHHTLIRAALDRYGGREVHTGGDGFLATFDSPRRAIECARAAGAATRSIGLNIRAGVHTGEIELSGDDVQGIAVHIGAHISALAGGGEVLVSSTVKDLVAGSGLEFDDRGGHSLKGIPGEWRVFSVSSP